MEPDRNCLHSGDEQGDCADAVRHRLDERGLDPVLVLTRERWERDLAGGPEGVPERLRTAAELAVLRADGEERQLPTVSERTWDIPEARRGRPARFPGRGRERHRHQGRHVGSKPGPGADGADPLHVSARSWTLDTIAVAVVVTATGEDLPGTRRLFADDDDGLVQGALWRGQLEFVCEAWADPDPDPDPDSDELGLTD